MTVIYDAEHNVVTIRVQHSAFYKPHHRAAGRIRQFCREEGYKKANRLSINGAGYYTEFTYELER